jgi:hypothetical protein
MMRELDLNRLVPATLIARKAFYALGRSDVWTNNYKNCRTVKAYGSGSDVRDAQIVSSITKLLADNGYNGVTAHLTEAPSKYRKYRPGAIIIRIPK